MTKTVTRASKYKTVSFTDSLYDSLTQLAAQVAAREGLSKVSLTQLIERMKKVYEENTKPSKPVYPQYGGEGYSDKPL